MKWYEAILTVAIAMWAYDRLRQRLAPRGRHGVSPEESEASFARGTLRVFERAVREYPDVADAHLGLGRTLNDLGRHDEALKAFGRADELDPGSYADYWSGRVSLRMGNNGEALEFFDRSIARHPDDADLHYLRGRALAQIAGELDPEGAHGHYEMAVGAFGQALRLDPGHADAPTALDRVRRRLAAEGAAGGEPGPDAELALAGGGSR